MSDGNRSAQVAAGVFVGAVGAAMLLAPVVVLKEMPSGPFVWVGGGALLVALWLVVPVGMGGLMQQARRTWHEVRGHEEDG